MPPGGETCDYCGLPLASGWWKSAPTARPAYCCSGCRIAAAVSGARGPAGETRWMLARLGLAIFLSMNVLVFTMALWSDDVYGAARGGPETVSLLPDLFRYLGLLFSLPVLFLLGEPLVECAWQALRRGEVATDVLIVVGVAAAYIFSAISTFRGQGHVYFEVGCVVLIVVSIGRWLEATGKLKTNEALDAMATLLPAEVRLLDGRLLPRTEAAAGDMLRVAPGERFAVDGEVVDGACDVDEQVVSGESRTVTKRPGERVFSGTLNVDGDVVVRVTAAAGADTVSRMIELVRRAREVRGRYQRAANAVAAWFVPSVALVALGTLLWHAATTNLETGLMAMLAVALIACPCALGLATPMAVWGALGTAARRQIVFQNGEAIERLAAVRAVRFDKTGTLTTGEPEVAHFIADDDTAGPEALRRAGSLAAGSTHILAGAIRRFAPAAATAALIADLHHVAGHGILGRISAETTPTSLGSVQWLRHNGLVMPPSLATARAAAETSGNSLSAIGWAGRVRGLFVFRETVRPQATAALNRCRQLGLDVAVLTGDHPRRAELLSQELGAPTIGGLLPQDKVVAVREAHCALGSVAMVGDGMNDAPALAAADVGVAMGCGADLTRGAASVCLLGNDLMRLPEAIELARLTRRIIRQNLFWAFGFNTAGVALAAAGCLNPVLAAAAMAASSVLVVGNSLRVVTSSRLDTEPAATIAPVPEPTINAAACR